MRRAPQESRKRATREPQERRGERDRHHRRKQGRKEIEKVETGAKSVKVEKQRRRVSVRNNRKEKVQKPTTSATRQTTARPDVKGNPWHRKRYCTYHRLRQASVQL